ncbi:AAA family ATPase [[Clostridium] spiroforme]|nr:AAA family ATPase [Thomasclavelia spiroformis]MBM6881209.1 AAA family ATPase [Thomasclavelia spiroformis]
MEITTYYGMDRNPFIKDAAITTLFTSNDFNQMTNRLEFIIRSRGIGVFLSSPGMGKTTCLRKTLESLNPNRYVVIYICMTTVTAIDFYRMLNDAPGLEETTKKSQMFSQIQEELKRLTSENKMEVIIAIDEAQFLRKEVLREFIMLLNFDYDSKDYCTLIFVGQNEFLRTLRLKSLEPFRQRINMNYTFTGFNEEEVRNYVVSRLQSVNCRNDLFRDECYHTLYSLMNTSVRILNLLINKSLILGMHYNKEYIDSELIMEASKELMLG